MLDLGLIEEASSEPLFQKVVFLDIDGVLCPYPPWQIEWQGNQNCELDYKCCHRLKQILSKAKARVVFTSSWRLFQQTIDELKRQWVKNGLAWSTLQIMGTTECLEHRDDIKTHNELRWVEIDTFIKANNITKYVILDDFNLERFDKPHFVRTKRFIGLTDELRNVCIRKLNTPV